MSSPLKAWKLLMTNSLQSAEVIFSLLGLTQGVVIPKKTMKHRHFPVVIFFTIQGGFEVNLLSHLTLRIYIQFLKCVCICLKEKVSKLFSSIQVDFMVFVGKFITRYLNHLQLQVTSSLILAKFGQLISPFRAWYSLEGKSTPGRRLTFINNSYWLLYI